MIKTESIMFMFMPRYNAQSITRTTRNIKPLLVSLAIICPNPGIIRDNIAATIGFTIYQTSPQIFKFFCIYSCNKII